MKKTRNVITASLLIGFALQTAMACPFCLAPMQTWSEMVAESDVVCLAKLISVSEGSSEEAAHSIVEVQSIHKGKKLISVGKAHIEQHIYGQPGDLLLLKGGMQDKLPTKLVETFATDSDGNQLQTKSEIQTVSATKAATNADSSRTLEWDFIERVTPVSYRYITETPSPKTEPVEKLTYFLPFLEHSDPLIAADAWGEFANADYKDIVSVRKQLPREKLRNWINQKDTSPERLGLYGMMLGLCGHDGDAEFLRRQIGTGNRDELRFGVEGLMGGLLLLAGEDGLKFLEETRLQNPNTSDLESLAVIHALQFVWTYEAELIPKTKLRAALHPMLNNGAVREIAIRDLARWNDWSLVPQLSELYSKNHQSDPGSTRAIVGYLITCQKSEAATASEKESAGQLLDKIRKQQPQVVRMVERRRR